jgi:hypothetical protein
MRRWCLGQTFTKDHPFVAMNKNMAQNTAPVFTQTPRLGFGFIDTLNNTFTMTTGTSHSLFVAGPSGSYVTKIRVKPSGSSAATVLRFFLNNNHIGHILQIDNVLDILRSHSFFIIQYSNFLS